MWFDRKQNDGGCRNGGEKDGLPPGDLAMSAFRPVEKKAVVVASCMVTIANKAQFAHI